MQPESLLRHSRRYPWLVVQAQAASQSSVQSIRFSTLSTSAFSTVTLCCCPCCCSCI